MFLYCMTLLSVTGAHVVAAGLSRKVGYTLRQLDASGKKYSIAAGTKNWPWLRANFRQQVVSIVLFDEDITPALRIDLAN